MRTEGEPAKKIGVWVEAALDEWLAAEDKNDALRVISAEPGRGKSSFLKMWAAKLSQPGQHRVLLIPLADIDLKSDFTEAVHNFIRTTPFLENLPPEVLDPNPGKGEPHLLLIFDGLDELVMQGKAMQDLAQQFIQEVKNQLNNMNHLTCRLMVILSGRKILIDTCHNEFRKRKQILTLLPYYIVEKDRNLFTYEENMMDIDRRQIWWREYGLATGNDYQGLPGGLERDQLGEITSEPLLNHLVAVTYREDPDFFTPDTNINNIYKKLIDKIFNRVWVNNPDRCHPALTGITSEDQFFDILQEIAVAAWHSKATRKIIWKRIVHLNYQDLFKDFEKEAEKGVTRVLTGFYFHRPKCR